MKMKNKVLTVCSICLLIISCIFVGFLTSFKSESGKENNKDSLLLECNVDNVKVNNIDISKFKTFYVPAGTVLECYATTLHYGPCEVQKEGFGWVVALPEGTNTELEGENTDKLLWAKNKWLIAHVDNAQLVSEGAVAGVTGTNIEIKY